jgi:hypothetical protein
MEVSSMKIRRILPLLLPLTVAACGGGGDDVKAKAWLGKTFLLDTPATSNAHWNPSALGPFLNNYAPQFLLGIEAGTGDELVVTLATASEGAQDMCNPTAQATFSGASYPQSTIAFPTFLIHVVSKDPMQPGQVLSTAYDLTFKDILPGLPGSDTARVSLWVDLGELINLLMPGGSKEALCQASLTAGLPCDTCPSNGQPFCRSLAAEQIVAREVALPIVQFAAKDIPLACL